MWNWIRDFLRIRVSRTQISCEFCNMLRSWRWDQGKDLSPLLYIWFWLMQHFHSSQNLYQAKQLQCKNPVSSITGREGSWLISLKLNFPQGLFFIARNHRPSVSACRDTAPGGDIKLPLLCQQISFWNLSIQNRRLGAFLYSSKHCMW